MGLKWANRTAKIKVLEQAVEEGLKDIGEQINRQPDDKSAEENTTEKPNESPTEADKNSFMHSPQALEIARDTITDLSRKNHFLELADQYDQATQAGRGIINDVERQRMEREYKAEVIQTLRPIAHKKLRERGLYLPSTLDGIFKS